MRNILSIDGGGVRGIVAAIVLDALDGEFKVAGKTCAVADCFDLIAGTSSGAIMAAALSLPAPDGGPGPTPGDLRRFFETKARAIFPPRLFCNIPLIGRLPQLFGPLHDPAPLSEILSSQFGDMVFASARRNVMIPAYSIDPRDIVLFRGGPAYANGDEGGAFNMIRVRDAVMGSSAAPTFFPPHRVENPDQAQSWTAIDGGVFLNDPAMTAVAEAMRLFPGEDLRVVSVGTGRQTRNYPFEKSRRWGFSEWISPTGRFRTPLLSAIQDGQARAVHTQLHYLLGDNYTRFDYRLEKGRGSDKLDDASRKNIQRLTRGAVEMVEEMRPQLRALARALAPVYDDTVAS
ncbi:MAG: patatin-like phospholipase family protein [Pseudomonadota bacterium]